MESITMTAVANKILVKQCSASIERSGAGVPVSRGTSHISACSDDISKPNTCLSYLLFKLRTRVSWAIIMLTLGTLYMLVNVMNFLDLYNEDLHYALVIGPPSRLHLILLFCATISSSVLYFPETFNTISILFRQKGTLLTITIDMVVTITLVHIPISALNYFIAQCRDKYTSIWQILSGVFSIVYAFMRIVWFAHMQGKKLKTNEKKEIRQGLFMAVCALFSCAIAFMILTWRDAPLSVSLHNNHTKSVSILLVQKLERNNKRLTNQNINSHLYMQGLNPKMPYMVKTVSNVIGAGDNGISVYYDCADLKPDQMRPEECSRNGTSGLLFKFVFNPDAGGPYGEILYNFAMVDGVNVSSLNIHSEVMFNLSHSHGEYNKDIDDEVKDHDAMQEEKVKIPMNNLTEDQNHTTVNFTRKKPKPYILTKEMVFSPLTIQSGSLHYRSCMEAASAVAGDWQLWYLVVTQDSGSSGVGVKVTSPWVACTTPHPHYSTTVQICPQNPKQ